MSDLVKQWKAAHPDIEITEEALNSVAPFPSLFANDLAVYLESKGQNEDVVQFVRDLNREIVWVYGNWTKAQRDQDAQRLLLDLYNTVRQGAEYELTRKFLTDYAKANNIKLLTTADQGAPAWLADMQSMAPAHPAYNNGGGQ